MTNIILLIIIGYITNTACYFACKNRMDTNDYVAATLTLPFLPLFIVVVTVGTLLIIVMSLLPVYGFSCLLRILGIIKD